MNIEALLILTTICGILMIIGMIIASRDKEIFVTICFAVGTVLSIYNSVKLYGLISN